MLGITRHGDRWAHDTPFEPTRHGLTPRCVGACYAVAVSVGTTHVKVALSHPSGAALGLNVPFSYTVTVRDAAGQELGTTSETLTQGAGTATALIDLRSFTVPPVAYGAFTFEVSGELSVSDPDTLDSESALGRMVTLQVAQLVATSP